MASQLSVDLSNRQTGCAIIGEATQQRSLISSSGSARAHPCPSRCLTGLSRGLLRLAVSLPSYSSTAASSDVNENHIGIARA
jgi:hypothetical protein